MKNINILIAGLAIVIFSALAITILNSKADEIDTQKTKVAVCPTYYELAQNLDPQKYEIIHTSSTSESLSLLQEMRVETVLAGRTPKPNEKNNLDSVILDEGYSFLSSESMSIYGKDLKNYNIYTDLPANTFENIPEIEKIQQVDDVYEYPDKGIIITSWENTDYNRAEIVHVMETADKRLAISRQPTIYCLDSCKKNHIETLIKNLTISP